jgi:ribonuclease E
MKERILIDAVYPEEIRVAAISKDNKIKEFDYESTAKRQLKGNIYLAKITRVEPSLQAAFVEYGADRHGFLPFAEIHPDYYQIPLSDREKLLKEQDAIEEQSSKADEENDDIDNDVDDAGEEFVRKSRRSLTRKYDIQEVIKKNQLLLVQVIKEERGNKGVSLSSYISLAGRYCVLMPNSGAKSGGVSKRIGDYEDRKRLKDLVKSFTLPKGVSLILRTAVAGKDDSDIKKDYDYLTNLWNSIREKTLTSSAPALVHKEAYIIKRTIRDLYHNNIEEILVEGEQAFHETKEFVTDMLPEHVHKVREYKGKAPIFAHFKVEKEIASFYNNVAQLKSGGSIVMNITEALIAIDVNSGKATKERRVEETALRTNLDAAREVARQLRLRDLSGLIVIDFIDMLELKNRKAVERELKNALAHDRAKIQTGRISTFGLLEMSRQRLKPSLLEISLTSCKHCRGSGMVRSEESISTYVFRAIKREVQNGAPKTLKVNAAAEVANHLLNYKRTNIAALEAEYKMRLCIFADPHMSSDEITFESLNTLPVEEQEVIEPKKSSPAPNRRPTQRNDEKSKPTSERDNKKPQDKQPQVRRGLIKQIFNKIINS